MTFDELAARLARLEQQQQLLLDRQAIEDCVMAYARGLDRLDADLIRDAFHPDALDDHGLVVAGRDELAEWATATHEAETSLTQHYAASHSCEVDGDEAHAETYWLAVVRHLDGAFTLAGGRWIDRLERRDGLWRIQARKCIPEWSGKPEMAAIDALSQSLQMASVKARRDRSDPSYDRPLRVDRARLTAAAAG